MSKQFFGRFFAVVLVVVLFVSLGTRVWAEDGGRRIKSKVSPTYPELAKKVNAKGTVKIEIVIAPNGVVKSTKVIGGHPLLVSAAEDAVKKWRYEPASEETTTVIEFNFTGM